jgi:hypothetical protein
VILTINERSIAYLTIRFLDRNEDLAVPTSISYRIDCVTSRTQILDNTPFVPAASEIEIVITPEQNRIVDASHLRETRRVAITATYGESDALTDEYEYMVANLGGVD